MQAQLRTILKKHKPARDRFHCRALNFNIMTFKLKCVRDILKMYIHTKNEIARSTHCKVNAQIEQEAKVIWQRLQLHTLHAPLS